MCGAFSLPVSSQQRVKQTVIYFNQLHGIIVQISGHV